MYHGRAPLRVRPTGWELAGSLSRARSREFRMTAPRPDQLLIVCKYAAGSRYAADARELVTSAQRFGYAVRAIEVADQGDWWRNCANKPRFLLDACRQHEGPLLCLDADCRVLAPLDALLARLEHADLVVRHRPQCCFTARFNAAVLLLRKSPATLSVLQTWAEHGERYGQLHRFVEQGAFAEGVLLAQQRIRVEQLEPRYHTMHAVDDGPPPADAAIIHLKASRGERRTALPTAPRVPADPRHADTIYCVLQPDVPGPLPALPTDGIPGALADVHEYASRYGIGHVITAHVPLADGDGRQLEFAKPQVMRQLCQQLPAGQRVVLCDFDTLLLRDPAGFAAPLANADLVVAWDGGDSPPPALAAIGFRNVPAIQDVLLPAWDAAWRGQPPGEPAETGGRALAQAIANTQGRCLTAALPARLVTTLAEAGPETLVLAVRGTHRVFDPTSSARPQLTPLQPQIARVS